MNRRLGVRLGLAVLALVGIAEQRASADQIFYYTNFGGALPQQGSIQSVDITTNTTTTIVSGLTTPDSLIFSSPNTILFSQTNTSGQSNSGTVNQVNINGTGNTPVASGLSFPEDMALDPGGQSVVVADSNNNRVIRINLTTHVVTPLATFGSAVRGVAYDAAGHLFVNVDSSQTTGSIVEINPLTGAVIKTLTLPSAGDGLTYDPSTGTLWAASISNTGIIRIANNLSSATEFDCTSSNGTVCGQYDGLEASGNGFVDLANTAGYIDQYNIASGTFSFVIAAPNIDDLAPIVGLGAPPPVTPTPEPASALLLATGVFALFLLRKRAFAKPASVSQL